MNYFDVRFSEEEIRLLKHKKIMILENQRYYIYDKNDYIPRFSTPFFFRFHDFHYQGKNWTDLIFSFGNWYTKKFDYLDNIIFLENSFDQRIFSANKDINYIGPLASGYFINNKLGSNTWIQIIDMLKHVGYSDGEIIFIQYPFQREDSKITEMINKKEQSLFYRYLIGLGYNLNDVKKHIENLIELNWIYNKVKYKETKNNQPITNNKIITACNKAELSNAFSHIRLSKYFKEEFYSTIENLSDFKSEIYYENRNYSTYVVNDYLTPNLSSKLS